MCRRRTVSDPSRSATVRATRSVRCQARAERLRRSAARISRARPSASGSAIDASSLPSVSALQRGFDQPRAQSDKRPAVGSRSISAVLPATLARR